MINEALGVRRKVESGDDAIETLLGRRGHAIYGPYVSVRPGSYIATFHLKLLRPSAGQRLCAILEVVGDAGQQVFARAPIFSSATSETYELEFKLDHPVERLEMRVFVNGSSQLIVRDACRVRAAPAKTAGLPETSFLASHRADVENLFLHGFGIEIADGELVIDHSGVRLHARVFDDIRFLGEIFIERVYNLRLPGPTVVIDVGMNIGATALLFAQNPQVSRVHAFEPFPTTYRRAVANLALNPEASGKIEANPFGLSDRQETRLGFINPDDSGMSSTTHAGPDGQSATVTIKDASEILAPIFAKAKADGQSIVMKIDCEGSEFPLFQSLARSGAIRDVSAMMVEWHRGFGDLERDLFAPLLANGFYVIDRDPPPQGNGFFYTVRAV